MSEPSQSSLILSFLVFVYLRSRRADRVPPKSGRRVDWREWLMGAAFLWVLFTTANTSAIVWLPIAVLPLITRRNAVWWMVAAGAAVAAIWCTPLGEIREVKRVKVLIPAVASLDPDRILQADDSAAARITPGIHAARRLAHFDIHTLTGHGVDADQRDLEYVEVVQRRLAGIFIVWYNYGLPCALAFWAFIIMQFLPPGRLKSAGWSYILGSVAAIVVLIFMIGENNNQLLWMPLIANALLPLPPKKEN